MINIRSIIHLNFLLKRSRHFGIWDPSLHLLSALKSALFVLCLFAPWLSWLWPGPVLGLSLPSSFDFYDEKDLVQLWFLTLITCGLLTTNSCFHGNVFLAFCEPINENDDSYKVYVHISEWDVIISELAHKFCNLWNILIRIIQLMHVLDSCTGSVMDYLKWVTVMINNFIPQHQAKHI